MYFNDYHKTYEETLRMFAERNIGTGQGFSRLGDGFSEYYHNNAEGHFFIEFTVDRETVRYDYLKKDMDTVIVFGMSKKAYQTQYSAPWVESEFPITQQKLHYDFHEFMASDRVKYVELLFNCGEYVDVIIVEVAGACIDEEDMLEKAYLQANIYQLPADKFAGFGDVIDRDGTQFAYMI